MGRKILVVLYALALTSCADSGSDLPPTLPASTEATPPTATATGPSTSLAGPDWATPGLEFLEALDRATVAGDDEKMLAFYHADARLVVPETGVVATGWRQISAAIDDLPTAEPDMTLIGYAFAATLSVGGFDCGLEGCTEPWVDLYQIYDGAIGLQVRGAGVSATDPLRTFYVDSAATYSAHDIDGLRRFHSEAVFAPPFPAEYYQAMFDAFPALAAEPMTLADLGLGSSEAPALFDLGETGASSTHSRAALGVYRMTFSPEIETVAATVWRLWDTKIVESTTVFDPNGWDRLFDELGAEPPDAWYTDIAVPEPRSVERTHVVELDDGAVVELFDASDRVADLVEWSIGRFELAGLPPPHAGAIYMETARSCLEESGWTSVGDSGSIIRICLSEDELGAGEDLGLAGQVTMLHELAHVWTAEYLAADVVSAFMAARGLVTWNDASAPWSERGNEHASEIMAWGLAEEAIDLVRLGESDCRVLRASFTLLTGAEPLHGC